MSRKGKTSATQRRDQVRQQRQQRINTTQNKQSRKRSRRRQNESRPWLLIGIIIAMVVVVVGVFIYLANQPSSQTQTNREQGAAALETITNLDPALLSEVGTGSAQEAQQSVMRVLPAGTPMPTGADGKPVFFYQGADYCPYCAAQRWGMIVALSQFGEFSQVEPITSQEGNHLTYSFENATYTSEYIDFMSLESINGQQPDPTSQQQQWISSYSEGGSIPFVLVGNSLAANGSFFQPTVLPGSYQEIADQVKNPNSEVARGIIGTANYLTAAICRSTQNQPANVCTAGSIPQIQQSLFGSSFNPDDPQLALQNSQLAIAPRRQYA